ncbi:LOW QUALITY PROTEIN: cell division topological specificity factor homolog, chloroplastic [Elaeis guineensis]|uniref:LOW QUALITY PROTEIN: cell division topological specificity factor homolog, chloroplastic n=1 Tax=Elaeis guineensis var. tenera TaxID=51953 RepID=UPI003C6CC7D7
MVALWLLWKSNVCVLFVVTGDELATTTINLDSDGFLLNAINMSFFKRLNLAWRILFPTPRARRKSNAKIAKQRLKMILFSDRCAVSDEVKQKIVSNIVQALSEFVEIDSQDKVQLSFSTDSDLGSVYSVAIPVRRVKPEYQESDKDLRAMTSIEYKNSGEASDSFDVQFDFFIPNEK